MSADWTFAGLFAWKASPEGFELTLLNNPVSRTIRADQPVCDYDAATFETLFRGLAGPSTRVEETACTAKGDAACMFRVKRRCRTGKKTGHARGARWPVRRNRR